MANITSANVRTIQAWTEGGLNGKRRIGKRVELYNAEAGGTTNLIPASAFGMRVVEETTAAMNANAETASDMERISDELNQLVSRFRC